MRSIWATPSVASRMAPRSGASAALPRSWTGSPAPSFALGPMLASKAPRNSGFACSAPRKKFFEPAGNDDIMVSPLLWDDGCWKGDTPTMLKRLAPNVMSEDVARSAAFYTDVLGFNLLARVPEEGEPLAWTMVQ